MILNKEEFLNCLKERLGDATDDSSIKFLEDMTDTYNDLESKSADKEDWKGKYDELDKSWREKYKSRFFESSGDDSIIKTESLDDNEGDNKITISDLFTEKEN